MSEKKLSGIHLLSIAEMRAISTKDMRQAAATEQQNSKRARVGVAELYSFYDDGKNSIHTSDSVNSYVDKLNQQITRRNDPFAEWHTRQDGKLSKNVPHRFVHAAEKIIADFNRGE